MKRKRGATTGAGDKRADTKAQRVHVAFRKRAKGLSRPVIIAALARAHKGPNKRGFVQLKITAATSREQLLGFLHSTRLALGAPPTLSPGIPVYMLTREAQTQCVADRLQSWSRGKETVKVRAEWTGSEWKLKKALSRVEETLQQVLELEHADAAIITSAPSVTQRDQEEKERADTVRYQQTSSTTSTSRVKGEQLPH